MKDDEKPILLEGFEKAFMGVLRRYGQTVAIPIYDYNKCLDILMDRDGMDEGEAVEWLEVNTLGGWVGEGTPAMLFRCTLREMVNECDLPKETLEEEDYGDVHEENEDETENKLTNEQQEHLEEAISNFALNFMRYIREVDPSLFLRAKQYAADYSGNKMIEFVIDDEPEKDSK